MAPNLRILIHQKERKETIEEVAPIRDKMKQNQERKSTVLKNGRMRWPGSRKIVENGDNIEVRKAIKVKKGKKKEKAFKNLPKKLRPRKTKGLVKERAHVQTQLRMRVEP